MDEFEIRKKVEEAIRNLSPREKMKRRAFLASSHIRERQYQNISDETMLGTEEPAAGPVRKAINSTRV